MKGRMITCQKKKPSNSNTFYINYTLLREIWGLQEKLWSGTEKLL